MLMVQKKSVKQRTISIAYEIKCKNDIKLFMPGWHSGKAIHGKAIHAWLA